MSGNRSSLVSSALASIALAKSRPISKTEYLDILKTLPPQRYGARRACCLYAISRVEFFRGLDVWTSGLRSGTILHMYTPRRAGPWFLLVAALSTAAIVTIVAGQDPRRPAAILERVDEMLAEQVADWCRGKLNYPPSCTVLRVFKQEGECEIWASDDTMENLVLVTTVPVCAVDSRPGPKLRQGDGKTPEGFFTCEFHFSSQRWWMWMKLSEEAIARPGIVGDGSCFKIFIRYPSELDRCNTRIARFSDPGGAIFLHGNCVTAGCVSFRNRDFLPVFAFSRHHQSGRFGPVQVHLFPFRFDEHRSKPEREQLARAYRHHDVLGEEAVLAFWANLEQGFERFNAEPAPLTIRLAAQQVFREGDTSPLVAEIAARLRNEGLFAGTGEVFSSDLATAVRQYQRAQGLAIDGVVGPATIQALGIHPCRYVF